MFKVLAAQFLLGNAFGACPPAGFGPMGAVNLPAYTAEPWYIQQRSETADFQPWRRKCDRIEYRRLPEKTFWGYGMQLHSYTEDVDGTIHDSDYGSSDSVGGDYATVIEEGTGKLAIGRWFTPSALASPHWIIDFSDEKGYALVSGGPLTVTGEAGKCKFAGESKSAGVWILTRAQQRNEELMTNVRRMAAKHGIDVNALHDVNQSHCANGTHPGWAKPGAGMSFRWKQGLDMPVSWEGASVTVPNAVQVSIKPFNLNFHEASAIHTRMNINEPLLV
jgi:hypothetical protein